jgi:hypothetical protein
MSQELTAAAPTPKPAVSPELLQVYHGLTASVPIPQQVAWLQLSNLKNVRKKELETKELEMQGLILKYETATLADLQTAVDTYEKGLKELPEMRKTFTRYLDKIFDELSAIEKRAKDYDPFAKAKARLMQLRLAAETNVTAVKDKNSEIAAFKTHVQNEYLRILAAYEIALNKTIVDSYTQALNDELTDDGLKQYVAVTEAALRAVTKLNPEKFTGYTIVTKEELQKIHPTIPAPDYAAMLQKYISAARERFNLYFQDKQNKEAAVAYLRDSQSKLEVNIAASAETKAAVNKLVNTGAPATTDGITPLGFKPIVRKKVIILKDDDPEWAAKIMSLFLANRATCTPRLKVTKWSLLSVKQMAAALQEEEEKFDGIEYDEVKK